MTRYVGHHREQLTEQRAGLQLQAVLLGLQQLNGSKSDSYHQPFHQLEQMQDSHFPEVKILFQELVEVQRLIYPYKALELI